MMAELKDATTKTEIEGKLFCFKALCPTYTGEGKQDQLQIYKATADPDTMYHHQAMQENDAKHFKQAMQKEWDNQFSNGNFMVMRQREVPEGATIFPVVWQMKRKQDICTRKIKKYKARLNSNDQE